ncbi:putative fasciclin-like arabinogalactan protein 20 [Syzygium oleosum]|uniref:putative fasciclin-like arabinogalactan protein 20 n=1 Tax=Syzygium oleosum TaxID=219896 RepID=UPI0011D2AA26|nr:putative fasciclin-like arabinogalactan protein 20 [Syzygium oleosum]
MATPASAVALVLLSLLPLCSPLPLESLREATHALSNSGFVSMSLTLNLISKTLISPQIPSLTIFSPSDDSFARFGQPPLSLLRLHFSPHALSLDTLRLLPRGAKISTMNANHSLMVTTSPSDYQVEINGVKIVGSPVFNDGNLVVFGIEMFFDPEFQTSAPVQSPSPGLECVAPRYGSLEDLSVGNVFGEACGAMRSKGYSVMASFLGLQLMKLKGDNQMLTVFTPLDESMVNHTRSFSDYPSIFLRHVVPCKLSASDILGFNNGTMVHTHLDGFVIEVTRIGYALMLNGVLMTSPDIYKSEWLSVHGVLDVIEAREGGQPGMEVSSESGRV